MPDNRELRIQEKISDETTGEIAISATRGGVAFEKIRDLMEVARLMAVSDQAVPKFLRGNVGGCFAVTMQALDWGGFSPFAVARQAYIVNDQIAYMSQMVHALIERNAPLKQRLRAAYEGEGVTRVCVIAGHLKGEVDPLVYRSPEIGNIKPKNSPLWVNDPDQQLFYFASRAWCRRYCPDVLLGVYSKDELEDSYIGADHAKDITPIEGETLAHRLSAKAAAATGFNAAAIAETVASVRVEPQTNIPESIPETKSPDPASSPAAPSEAAAVAAPQPEATSAEATTAAAADQLTVEQAAANEPSTVEPPTGADPEPAPAKREPDMPTDGLQYRGYVQAMLAEMTDPDDPKKWWGSAFQRKLRNSLPNIDQEVIDACKSDVVARAEQLKPKGNAA